MTIPSNIIGQLRETMPYGEESFFEGTYPDHTIEALEEYVKAYGYIVDVYKGGLSLRRSNVWDIAPTHCLCCGRPLTDSTSVDAGIGPVCRKKYNYEDAPVLDAPTIEQLKQLDFMGYTFESQIKDSRKAANNLVRYYAVIAHQGRKRDQQIQIINVLYMMGLSVLADKISDRLVDGPSIEIKGTLLFIEARYDQLWVDAIKGINGRKFDAKTKTWSVPLTQKQSLWSVIKAHFKGCVGKGPKGVFVVA
jgi:hypothetical protein